MGFRISYITADIPANELAQAFGLSVSGTVDDMPEAGLWVTRLKDGHAILWSNDELFGATHEAQVMTLSETTPVLCCIVNETVMASTVKAYESGRKTWEIDWQGDEGPEPDHLTHAGAVPARFFTERDEAIKLQQAGSEEDCFFEVPLNVAAGICEFRHDAWLEREHVEGFYLLDMPTPPKRGLLSRLLGKGA